jgi:hypothetical protein
MQNVVITVPVHTDLEKLKGQMESLNVKTQIFSVGKKAELKDGHLIIANFPVGKQYGRSADAIVHVPARSYRDFLVTEAPEVVPQKDFEGWVQYALTSQKAGRQSTLISVTEPKAMMMSIYSFLVANGYLASAGRVIKPSE